MFFLLLMAISCAKPSDTATVDTGEVVACASSAAFIEPGLDHAVWYGNFGTADAALTWEEPCWWLGWSNSDGWMLETINDVEIDEPGFVGSSSYGSVQVVFYDLYHARVDAAGIGGGDFVR